MMLSKNKSYDTNNIPQLKHLTTQRDEQVEVERIPSGHFY